MTTRNQNKVHVNGVPKYPDILLVHNFLKALLKNRINLDSNAFKKPKDIILFLDSFNNGLLIKGFNIDENFLNMIKSIKQEFSPISWTPERQDFCDYVKQTFPNFLVKEFLIYNKDYYRLKNKGKIDLFYEFLKKFIVDFPIYFILTISLLFYLNNLVDEELPLNKQITSDVELLLKENKSSVDSNSDVKDCKINNEIKDSNDNKDSLETNWDNWETNWDWDNNTEIITDNFQDKTNSKLDSFTQTPNEYKQNASTQTLNDYKQNASTQTLNSQTQEICKQDKSNQTDCSLSNKQTQVEHPITYDKSTQTSEIGITKDTQTKSYLSNDSQTQTVKIQNLSTQTDIYNSKNDSAQTITNKSEATQTDLIISKNNYTQHEHKSIQTENKSVQTESEQSKNKENK